MALTRQSIREQEFQPRLRGYDKAEVRRYLELVADEYGALLEQLKSQQDSLSEARARLDSATERAVSLERDLAAADELTRSLRSELTEHEVKIAMLEEHRQQREQEEIDFKRTIGAAQKFADDLIARAKDDAASLAREAEEEAERLRRETGEALAELEGEIDRLSSQRRQVKADLEQVLHRYLDGLRELPDEPGGGPDSGELFEQIDLPELAEIEGFQEDAEEVEPHRTDHRVEPDNELSDPLEDGGVAYLRDA